MKAIMVMFDSLNRRMLQPYGCDWVETPNFDRLAKRSVTFDNAYIGSMPCMPARRELHTGRYNFLHRSWGPIEPFDDSMPQLLQDNNIHSHLVTDHQHYWEDGGATYHNRYQTYEFVRGQEGDLWKGVVQPPDPNENKKFPGYYMFRQDQINRTYIQSEEMMPQARTFDLGLEFIDTNQDADNWFLQLETFDPHEPFFTQPEWKERYPHDYDGPQFDWPPYDRVTQSSDVVDHARYEYAALMTMCDHYLGKVLDKMDEHNLWDDTLLIVNTDHGYLLGEHDWWAKARMPWYNELANIPLFIWDPRSKKANEHRTSLVQTIDLPATILEYFGIDRPADMHGQPLRETIENDTPVRTAGLYGVYGGHVNVTDGRYVYMRATENEDVQLYNYTLMPTHMRNRFGVEELQSIGLSDPFDFTKNCQTLKIPKESTPWALADFNTLLFDLSEDAGQLNPIHDVDVENRMIEEMITLMKQNDAPHEQYERLGLV
jgi:arylsulfatase A-like enzyme